MRGISSIIVLISVFITFAGERDLKTPVWLDAGSYKGFAKDDLTLFFKEWNVQLRDYLDNARGKAALQLDQSLDPHPYDLIKLPDLEILAAINDESLLMRYFNFLENYGRTIGLDHLVLPDTLGMTGFEKEVVQFATDQSPYYFIPKSFLTMGVPHSKKGFKVEKPTIWVSKEALDNKRLIKWSKKVENKYFHSFYNGMDSKPNYEKIDKLPEELGSELFRKSVIAIDPNLLLPIKDDSIVYIGRDAELKKWLSKYVVVDDQLIHENQLVIIDCRFSKKPIQNQLGTRSIFIDFIGSSIAPNATSILVGKGVNIKENELAKMFFGAQEVPGRSTFDGNRMVSDQGFAGYSSPRDQGFSEPYLNNIQKLIDESVNNYAIPGAQLLVIRKGDIVLEEAFGHYTYDSLKEVTEETIYDLASLTKVLATLPAIALLVDQGKIKLSDSIGLHLTKSLGTNKSPITIKELLAHNGGTRSYIPFWSWAIDNDRLESFYYTSEENKAKDIRSYGLEPRPYLDDSLKNWILQSPLINNPSIYNYSDLGYMILHMLVEEVSGMPFDQFVTQNFYQPMGLNITFNPIEKGIGKEQIAPTEYDQRYRNGQVWGEVHDRNAHLFGGAAGHAGLFSSAEDVGKMMLMLSNGGYYGGKQYLKGETLESFNHRYFNRNRRGLGWDKKDGIDDSASALASDLSFGHTGFTGTMVWSDPVEELIYVFLSNRVYPNAENKKLMQLNTRTGIHDIIYESLIWN